MDARIDPLRALEIELGSAHVMRNGGALVSDDVLRSLILSQREFGTRSVAIIGHTDCGLAKVRDADVKRALEVETGQAPPFEFGSFVDLDDHVRAQVKRVVECPWLPHVDDVRGYVLDVGDGSLRPVD
jgi:carbonic anhydrase